MQRSQETMSHAHVVVNVFTPPLASPWVRFSSGLLDFIGYFTLQLFFSGCITILIPTFAGPVSGILELTRAVAVLCLAFGAPLVLWSSHVYLRQPTTISSSVKILLDDGRWPSFSTHLVRTLFWLLGTLTLGLGNLPILFHPKRKALHDMIAGTIVVPGSFHPELLPICSNCGYNLSATPDRCPECGARFNTASEVESKESMMTDEMNG